MASRRFFSPVKGVFLLLVFVCCPVFVHESDAAGPKKQVLKSAPRRTGEKKASTSGAAPIVVTARTLVADNKKKTVTYKKDVVVKKGDITMYADEVIIRLTQDNKTAEGGDPADPLKGSGKVDRIEAKGGVKVVQQDRTATSDEATYYSNTEKIVMTGRPRVWQGDNVLDGEKITYNIREDTFEVDSAHTVLYQQEHPRDLEPSEKLK